MIIFVISIISLMHFLFVEEKLIEVHLYNELQLAKELRIDTQYYMAEELDKEKLRQDSETAKSFVLKMEEVIEKLTDGQISILIYKLKAINETKSQRAWYC